MYIYMYVCSKGSVGATGSTDIERRVLVVPEVYVINYVMLFIGIVYVFI